MVASKKPFELLVEARDKIQTILVEVSVRLRATGLDPRDRLDLLKARDAVADQFDRANRRIRSVLAGSLKLKPPSEELLERSEALFDAVDGELAKAKRGTAIIRLVSNLAGVVAELSGDKNEGGTPG